MLELDDRENLAIEVDVHAIFKIASVYCQRFDYPSFKLELILT
jgi:hypothetical protein